MSEPSGDYILPIVMPLWERLERLPGLVEQLNAQTDQRFMMIFWLNGATPERYAEVDRNMYRLITPHGLLGSPENLGGWARYKAFHMACQVQFPLSQQSTPPFAALVDDDVDLKPNFVAWAKAKAEPSTIWGRHGFRFVDPKGSYWNRVGAGDDETAKDAHTVSTQATVLDTRVLLGPEILDVKPEEVLGMEDMWLCFVASTFYGYRIRAARPPATVIEDGKDTWPRIRERKNGLLQTLRAKGWKV